MMNISNHNDTLLAGHNRRLDFLKSEVNLPAGILQKLKDFQIAIPSWALGTGGTRFGRFSGGQIGFYAGCNPTKAIEVVEIIREVLADVVDNGMTHEEIERAKGAVRGSLVLSQEDSGSRMFRIGKNEIVYGQVAGFDDILKSISRVNEQDIREIASAFLTKTPTLALVGPFKNTSKFEKVLK